MAAVAAFAALDAITVTSEPATLVLQHGQTHAKQQRQLMGPGDICCPCPPPYGLDLFWGHEQRCRLVRELLITSNSYTRIDFLLVLGAELFTLLLIFQRQHWLVIGIMGAWRQSSTCSTNRPLLPAESDKYASAESSSRKNYDELVGGIPPLRVLLGYKSHLWLQPPGPHSSVEGDQVDSQLFRDQDRSLPVWRALPTSDNGVDRLAKKTHRRIPSRPLVKNERS